MRPSRSEPNSHRHWLMLFFLTFARFFGTQGMGNLRFVPMGLSVRRTKESKMKENEDARKKRGVTAIEDAKRAFRVCCFTLPSLIDPGTWFLGTCELIESPFALGLASPIVRFFLRGNQF